MLCVSAVLIYTYPMKDEILIKIAQAEDVLGLIMHSNTKEFIANLQTSETSFGHNKWLFYTILEIELEQEGKKLSISEASGTNNYITALSQDFMSQWNMRGMVIADNGCGDYLMLLPSDYYSPVSKQLGESFYIVLHETREIKLYHHFLSDMIKNGGLDYFGDYIFRANILGKAKEADWAKITNKYIRTQKTKYKKRDFGFHYRVIHEGDATEKPLYHKHNSFEISIVSYLLNYPFLSEMYHSQFSDGTSYFWQFTAYFGKRNSELKLTLEAQTEIEQIMQEIGRQGVIECIVSPKYAHSAHCLGELSPPFAVERWVITLQNFCNDAKNTPSSQNNGYFNQAKLF